MAPTHVMHEWVTRLLGPGGSLASALQGFAPRAAQLALAEAVADAFRLGQHLVCEAGTGTGKTFAYLVPALTSGRKVIVSTGTRNLQDQLFHRDLPVLRALLPGSARVALLKGRANYLCLKRLADTEASLADLPLQERQDLARVTAWASKTASGDLAQVAGLSERSSVFTAVTSTAENCLGSTCPQFERCWVVEARRQAAASDLVVVNHHLLLADMLLRDEGFGELLPGAEVVIVDEAHQLPEVARVFFGRNLSLRQVLELARDGLRIATAEAGDTPDLRELAHALEPSVRAFRLAFGRGDGRGPLEANESMQRAFSELDARLLSLQQGFAQHAERSPDLAHVARRGEQLRELLAAFQTAASGAATEQLAWFECRGQGLRLQLSPLDVADPFRARLQGGATWIFTSATLAVAGDFRHFVNALGITGHRELVVESPFDYARQALLYLPSLDCEPRDSEYTSCWLAEVLPLLEALDGRTFLLVTSHRALTEAAVCLRAQARFRLLVQGEAPRQQLLQEFSRAPGQVLIGTSSFWEGVDVRGANLSCVVIDKLPFAAPDDPLLKARTERLRTEGGDPFREIQVPAAVLALKQGVGRLIRDQGDRGLLVLCDPRLTGKSYGRSFLGSLPEMPRTREAGEALAYCRALAAAF